MRQLKIYLEFKGVVVENNLTQLGRENAGCFKVIAKLQAAGHEIILNSESIEYSIGATNEALAYLNKKLETKITYYTRQKVEPWPWHLSSLIAEGSIYIDSKSDGIPTKPALFVRSRMVDWDALDQEFSDAGIYYTAKTLYN